MVEDGGNVVINKREQLCTFCIECVYITRDRMCSRSLNNVTFTKMTSSRTYVEIRSIRFVHKMSLKKIELAPGLWKLNIRRRVPGLLLVEQMQGFVWGAVCFFAR